MKAKSIQRPCRLLFVCLGNICRSPLAEGIFIHLVEEQGRAHQFEVDSAGTGNWHIGERPDPRSLDIANQHKVTLPSRARQIVEKDFHYFDLILAMDQSNLHHLTAMKPPGAQASLYLMREFDSEPGDYEVPDPYFGGDEGFEHVYTMLHRSSMRLLTHAQENFLYT